MFKLSLLELKKIFMNKGIYAGILIASMFSIIIGMQAKVAPDAFNSKHVFSFFASIANLVLIVFASKSLGDEFQLKTSTQLFTSRQSRMKILGGKILSLMFLSAILAVISGVILIAFKFILKEDISLMIAIKDMGTQLFSYGLYAFVIGSFALCVTTVNFNTTSTMVTTLSAFWIAPNIISLLIDRFPQGEKLFRLLPFYSADALTSYHDFTAVAVAILAAFGLAVFASNLKLISKIDLR